MPDQQHVSQPESSFELTVVIISYNTKQLTLKALKTLYENTEETRFACIVYDNGSADGSACAIAKAFPDVTLQRSAVNMGFARANNAAAARCTTPYLLLLNPDTECQPGSIDTLMRFAKNHASAGIWGGRTVFPDGALNIASCWAAPSLRSLLFRATGFSAVFKSSGFFNPEAYAGWHRDTARQVDIVVGCFLLVDVALWRRLGGFGRKYFMYGEDADLCLRARAIGHFPMVTPDAQIVHHVGASTRRKDKKTIAVMKARASLVRDHWPAWKAPLGIALMWLWSFLRYVGSRPLSLENGPESRTQAAHWKTVWSARRDWLSGYDQA